ncbi:hypothetical protein [Burkholderia gladioli]|uniref:hypothetical protein n=1 Tax=Burkholderia gladioli TaxID=28095 RepID=UPI00163DF7FD|nr:hypothetical protein [Burkholderia gladioli]
MMILESDELSHGGQILTCASTNTANGEPLALPGDVVTRPKQRGIDPDWRKVDQASPFAFSHHGNESS